MIKIQSSIASVELKPNDSSKFGGIYVESYQERKVRRFLLFGKHWFDIHFPIKANGIRVEINPK